MLIVDVGLQVLLPVDEVHVAFVHLFKLLVKVVKELIGLGFIVLEISNYTKKDVVKCQVALNGRSAGDRLENLALVPFSLICGVSLRFRQQIDGLVSELRNVHVFVDKGFENDHIAVTGDEAVVDRHRVYFITYY